MGRGRRGWQVEISYVASPPDLINPRLLAGAAGGQRRHVHPDGARGQVPQIKLLRPPSSSTADCHPTSQAASQTARQPSRERGLPDVRTARRSAAAEAGVRRRGTRRGTGRRERGERWVGGSLAGRGGGLRGWWALSSPPPVLGSTTLSSWLWDVRACRLPSRLRPRLRARRGGGRLGVRVAAVAVGSARLAGVVGPDVLLGSWTSSPLRCSWAWAEKPVIGRLRLTTGSTSVKKLQRL